MTINLTGNTAKTGAEPEQEASSCSCDTQPESDASLDAFQRYGGKISNSWTSESVAPELDVPPSSSGKITNKKTSKKTTCDDSGEDE